MTKREAYAEGYDYGVSAAEDCEVYDEDKQSADGCECSGDDSEFCSACLTVAAHEAEQNGHQYADHPACTAAFRSADENREAALWEAYERGVTAGIKAGVKARLAQVAGHGEGGGR